MKTTISANGRIVLPASLLEQDQIAPGEEFAVERIDRGEYRLLRQTSVPNAGVIDWLLASPEKGFFAPIDSESTDAL
jgi:bifunctional DNA-binding transcriptional regulator/antitoxin component of YhaV-PrlF toxin-antitoxin module